MPKVGITDTILRDGHQSQAATRMKFSQMEPMLAKGVAAALYAPTTGTVNPWQLGIAACEMIGEHATTAVRYAHRAVHKGLKLDLLGELSANSANFVHCQFTCQNNPFSAHIVKSLRR